MEYLTVGELVKKTKMAETTIRRYLNTFDSFFYTKKFGTTTKYHSGAADIIKQIYDLYEQKNDTEQVLSYLEQKNPQIFEVAEIISRDLVLENNTLAVLEGMKKMQNEMQFLREDMQFEIQALRSDVQELNKILSNHDVKLVNQIRSVLEEKKKPFWKSWFS